MALPQRRRPRPDQRPRSRRPSRRSFRRPTHPLITLAAFAVGAGASVSLAHAVLGATPRTPLAAAPVMAPAAVPVSVAPPAVAQELPRPTTTTRSTPSTTVDAANTTSGTRRAPSPKDPRPARTTRTTSATDWGVDGFASLAGGTTGGAGGRTVTVSTLADLTRYAAASEPYVVRVDGTITLTGQVKVAANKTIVGVGTRSGLSGGGLAIKRVSNVIVANLVISKAKGTDAITVWGSHHVLVTHNDLSSDLAHGKDHYDGLVDITQGSDLVTVSWNRFHDHYKVMLIGHSDKNAAVDTGKLRVTVHHNSFTSVGSRLPSLRFGTGHVYDNVFTNVSTSAVHSRMGALILAQNNLMTNVKNPYVTHADSRQDGTILRDPATPPAWPYRYVLERTGSLAATVASSAGPR